jgi:hypothetical protein
VVARSVTVAAVALGWLLAACSARVSEPDAADSYAYADEDDPLKASFSGGCGDCDPAHACAQTRADARKAPPERDSRAFCQTLDREVCKLDPEACRTPD